jgi:hypothetical protein
MSPAVVFPGCKTNSEQERRRGFKPSPVLDTTPVVCVLDGDGLARESLRRLIGCEGCDAKHSRPRKSSLRSRRPSS